MLCEPDRRIAGSFGGQLPQAADLLRRWASSRRVEGHRTDTGGREQRTYVETLGGKHFRNALHPYRGGGPFAHRSHLPAAQGGFVRPVNWPSGSMTVPADRYSV